MKNTSSSGKKKTISDRDDQLSKVVGRLMPDQVPNNTSESAANDAVQGAAVGGDLERVQEILFGDSSREFERKLTQLSEQFSASIKALQDTFASSVATLRDEAISAAQQQQQALSKNRDQLLARIDQSSAQLAASQLRAEQKTDSEIAAMRTDVGNRLRQHSNETRQAEATLQESKVDRGELALVLEQLAKVVRASHDEDEDGNAQVAVTRKR